MPHKSKNDKIVGTHPKTGKPIYMSDVVGGGDITPSGKAAKKVRRQLGIDMSAKDTRRQTGRE